MSKKYFTLEEANALLPQITPLVADLVERRAKVARLSTEVGPLMGDFYNNIGGAALSAMTQDFAAIEQRIDQIQAYGCYLKDINTGLLDFLSLRHGREVFLCWRYGEPRIAYYHELHAGFNGRQPL